MALTEKYYSIFRKLCSLTQSKNKANNKVDVSSKPNINMPEQTCCDDHDHVFCNPSAEFSFEMLVERGMPCYEPVEEKLCWLRSQIIGNDAEFNGPFGRRKLVYADHTASGRSLHFIENFITNHVLPFYGIDLIHAPLNPNQIIYLSLLWIIIILANFSVTYDCCQVLLLYLPLSHHIMNRKMLGWRPFFIHTQDKNMKSEK